MGIFLILFLVIFPMAAALPVYSLRRRGRELRDRYVRFIPLIELAAAAALLALPGSAALPGVCGLGLYFASGSLHSLLAVLTAFLWVGSALPCREYFAAVERCNRFYFSWLMTLGALMGVFLSSDLFTLFVFFEMMSFTSYIWVVQNETAEALRAGETYLAIAVAGGMALLAGLLLLRHLLGTLEYAALPSAAALLPESRRGELLAAGFLCLTGLGAKAGLYPLHIWLPKAHPVAPAPASALLSGILTKSGVFGVLVLSCLVFRKMAAWNTAVLVLGVITMVLGGVLALFSVDLKRTLACSSMSQIGFIAVGIAMQGFLGGIRLAVWGAELHILNHALVKLVLFVAAGAVYLGTHSLDLNEIRGWGRNKPLFVIPFFIAAASLCGVPGFAGYASKTLLHESIVEYIHLLPAGGAVRAAFRGVEMLFLFSGGLTAAYMARLFDVLFVEPRPSGKHLASRELSMHGTEAALAAGAAALAVMGVAPALTMTPIAAWGGTFLRVQNGVGIHYYTAGNLLGAVLSLGIGAGLYYLTSRGFLRRKSGEEILFPDRWPRGLDLENALYRPLLRGASFAGALCARVVASAGEWVVLAGEKLLFLRAPGIFVPKRNENFGAYGRKPGRSLVAETFSFDLLLAGAGLISMLAYLLTRS